MLFSDIEGSTVLLRRLGDRYGEALSAQRALLRSAFSACGGQEMGTEGDSFFVVFASAGDAVRCCVAAQRALCEHDWPGGVAVRVRIGLHSGEPVRHEDGYVGLDVHRAARIAAAAHGGQVVVSEATRLLVESKLPTGVSLRDLGFYQLKDLQAPERIYQLVAAGLPEQFPPLKSLGAGVAAGMAGLHGFPATLTSFVGRSGELDEVVDLLARHRLVTATGPGGVGKTRLASAVARRVADRFADGAWLAELAPVRDVRGVDDTVAVVFSVTARAGQSTREALVELLRGKELLLVLDNCEHVLAGAAALAEDLAQSCERLVILATSREGLGIGGERLVPVPPLRVPGAGADLAAITRAEAVRLFAERAAAVKPHFAVTALNAEAIAAVVRRLDGIALAIELAAARVPAMTPAELSRRLERSFAVLAAGRRGAAARHQTLRATIDWSFQLLTEPEQRLLARLAVFAGGCTLQAAEAVCGVEDIDPDAVFELLASLVARSLVVAEEHGLETRYRLLETIRQFGEERLDEVGESERWRARHADCYADLLRQVHDHAPSSRDEVFWAVRLSAEQDNLLGAWSWAISTGNVGTAFRILAGFASVEIWRTYPLVLPGEAALELPGASEHPGYPLALAVSAVFASNRADVTGAEELCYRAAEANARQDPPDWRVEVTICTARQNIATTTGAFADAARFAEQAAGMARAGGDLAEASLEFTIAAFDRVLDGDDPRAVPLADEALTLARQIGDPALVATCLLGVGMAVASTDPVQARACLRESRELSTGFGYEIAFDLGRATGIAFLVGDMTAALELGRGAIFGLRWGGDRVRMGLVLSAIAGTLAAIRPDAAAIIQGAVHAYVVESSRTYQVVNSIVTAAVGEERTRELRARGAEMDWEQAVAYTLTQTSQALNEVESETQP
jgi:predicted ATPase/class 3 adenylate cyclase